MSGESLRVRREVRERGPGPHIWRMACRETASPRSRKNAERGRPRWSSWGRVTGRQRGIRVRGRGYMTWSEREEHLHADAHAPA